MIKNCVLIFVSFILVSCATRLGPAPVEEAVVPTVPPVAVVEPEPLLKYSNMNNMAPPSDRNYRRMNRQKMEEEAQLQESAGSLWVMDGQTSYLFSQNKHRVEGDPTAIKVEGSAMKQIETKVAVIQDLLKELDAQRVQADEEQKKVDAEKLRLAEEERKTKEDALAKNNPNYDPYAGQYPLDPAEEAKRKPAAVAEKKAEPAKPASADLKEVSSIPSKIVEKTKDGMYRIRGQQFLTINQKPYKVIATGLVRIEDFDDLNISSNKLREAQYDVIHIKRTE